MATHWTGWWCLLGIIAMGAQSLLLPASQMFALEALYRSTNGAGWTLSSGSGAWNFSKSAEGRYLCDPCTSGWYGLQCNSTGTTETPSLSSLSLSSSNLLGTIPAEISALTGLRNLDLSVNSLEGTVASELYSLTGLQYLDLDGNSLSGTIASEISHLIALRYLYLNDNSIGGAIPSELGRLTLLSSLDLSKNILSSTVPPAFWQLTRLTTLSLYRNKLWGEISSNLGQLTRLVTIYIFWNKFVGNIPTSIGSLTNLEEMNIGRNHFSSSLPSEIGRLTRLQDLIIASNSLSGTIPTEIGNLVNLKNLNFAANSLEGSIPSSFRGLTGLTSLMLNANRLTSSLPAEIGSLTRLELLSVAYNRLTGPLPSSLQFLGMVEYLIANNNTMTGTIPTSLGRLVNLIRLVLDNNSLQGPIPSELGSLTCLLRLLLQNNFLSGEIPSELGSLNILREFQANDNLLSGSIPSSFLTLTDLWTLDLSDNDITGSIPYVGKMTALRYFRLHGNRISGQLPSSLNLLTGLRTFTCSDNRCSGSLPRLDGLALLEELMIANNAFTGSLEAVTFLPSLSALNASYCRFSALPSGLGGLANLRTLDAAGNFLSGKLPSELGGLRSLSYLQLSHNALEGPLPASWCGLGSLQSMDLSRNFLSGGVPSCLSGLLNLTALSLTANKFGGPLDFLSPNLYSIDVSDNFFVGYLPDQIFTSTKLIYMAAAINCLEEGFLPKTICDATSLEVLVLDGMSAACHIDLFARNGLGFTGTTEKYNGRRRRMARGLPSCIFTALPNISTLHLSGNSLSGQPLSGLSSWPAKLTDLSISHNRISGKICAALQRGLWQFQRFDVAVNKLSGDLSAVQLKDNGARLNFIVNRFSGLLSPSIIAARSLQVLQGSLISCSNRRVQLPASDPYLEHFECGSDVFNSYMIAFSVLSFTCCCLVLPSLYPQWSRLRAWLDPEVKSDLPPAVSCVLTSLRAVRLFALQATVLIIVALLPIYGLLSKLSGTYSNMYAWTVSAGFKSGVGAAAALLVLWVVTLSLVHWHLTSQYWRAGMTGGTVSQPPETNVDKSSAFLDFPSARSRLRVQALLLFRLSTIATVNFFCVLLPNIGYVQVVSSETSSNETQTAISLALGIFKIMWTVVAIPGMLSSRMLMLWGLSEQEIDAHGLEAWEGSFVLELALRSFCAVIAPAIALASYDPTCFSLALWAPPPVRSSFSIPFCTTDKVWIFQFFNMGGYPEFAATNHVRCTEVPHSLSFEPSFSYGFQCTATLLQTYTPVFLLTTLLSCFGVPALQWIVHFLFASPHQLGTRVCGGRIQQLALHLLGLPKMMRSAAQRLGEGGQSGATDRARQRRGDSGMLNTHALFMGVLQDLLILLTFGLAAPLLGIVVAISLYSRILRWHHLISDFAASDEERSGGWVAALEEDCCELCKGAHPLLSARFFLLFFAALFAALFLMDTAGDAVGFTSSLWAPLLMVLLPAVSGLLIDRRIAATSELYPPSAPYFPSASSAAASPTAENDVQLELALTDFYACKRGSSFFGHKDQENEHVDGPENVSSRDHIPLPCAIGSPLHQTPTHLALSRPDEARPG